MEIKELINKIKDIQKGITKVKNKYIFEENLELNYITIFSHSDNEFEKLIKTSEKIGNKIDEHNGPVFLLKEYLGFNNGILKIFRIRKPDKERLQIGCGDFKVSNYLFFKKKYLNRKNFILMKGDGYEFLGIHDIDENYLVYFPDKLFTEDLGL